MARFIEIERHLLEHVTDDRLRVSLAAIRQAMEDIWADDAPRIVQDYTDHGEKHCERLAALVVKLLEAGGGAVLTPQEFYVLLAGIYLHDIGMQCDVVRFPEIKARAETMGAQFGVVVAAPTSSRYSLDEQKAVRDNHQYLAAAWIDYASRTGATALGPAAQTIPQELVDDLADVCQYHARLPISSCPSSFRFDPTGRKQLVAALLRFADELDVDVHRVSIETVKTFSLDPRNGVYWWLHHRTRIVFTARNALVLTIRLHPDDARQYGLLVHAAFIAQFQSKNHLVLSVLAQNGIPLVISADSGVVEHDRAERLPPEIVQSLLTMQTSAREESRAPHSLAGADTCPSDRSTLPAEQAVPLAHILIVEDNANWRDTLSRLLCGAGYYVDVADEYGPALNRVLRTSAWLTAFELALCIVDLGLGEDTLEENWEGLGLLAQCKVSEIPAIVVSGKPLTRSFRKQLRDQYGVAASFDKISFPAREFLVAVKAALAVHEQPEEEGRASPPPKPTADTAAPTESVPTSSERVIAHYDIHVAQATGLSIGNGACVSIAAREEEKGSVPEEAPTGDSSSG